MCPATGHGQESHRLKVLGGLSSICGGLKHTGDRRSNGVWDGAKLLACLALWGEGLLQRCGQSIV